MVQGGLKRRPCEVLHVGVVGQARSFLVYDSMLICGVKANRFRSKQKTGTS